MDIIFLYERAAQILLYLLNSNTSRTISQIQNLIMVSNRTVRYDLDNIDDFLLANDMDKLMRKPRVGIAFVGNQEDREKLRSIIEVTEKYNYVFSPAERIIIIILTFIESDGYISTKDLSQKLKVSQSTVSKDLKKVRKILDKYNLRIIFRQRYGLKLIGKEKNIRKLLVEVWLEYVYNISDVKSKNYNHGKDKSIGVKKYIDKLIDDVDIPFSHQLFLLKP